MYYCWCYVSPHRSLIQMFLCLISVGCSTVRESAQHRGIGNTVRVSSFRLLSHWWGEFTSRKFGSSGIWWTNTTGTIQDLLPSGCSMQKGITLSRAGGRLKWSNLSFCFNDFRHAPVHTKVAIRRVTNVWWFWKKEWAWTTNITGSWTICQWHGVIRWIMIANSAALDSLWVA